MKGGVATTWIPAASLHGWDSVLNLCVSIILTEAKVGGVHFGHPPYQKDKIIG